MHRERVHTPTRFADGPKANPILYCSCSVHPVLGEEESGQSEIKGRKGWLVGSACTERLDTLCYTSSVTHLQGQRCGL